MQEQFETKQPPCFPLMHILSNLYGYTALSKHETGHNELLLLHLFSSWKSDSLLSGVTQQGDAAIKGSLIVVFGSTFPATAAACC